MVANNGGSWSAAEAPHRVSQKFVEATLHRHAARLPSVSLRYSWRFEAFEDLGDGVEAQISPVCGGEARRIKADYLFGADGPRSSIRRQLGIAYGGDSGADRDFMGGQMLAIYMKAPAFYNVCPHAKTWMYCSFNAERRALLIAVDGKDEFVFHTQLRAEEATALTDEMAQQFLEQAIGQRIPINILSRDRGWRDAPRWRDKPTFRKRQVFLHMLFTCSHRPAAWATIPRSKTP